MKTFGLSTRRPVIMFALTAYRLLSVPHAAFTQSERQLRQHPAEDLPMLANCISTISRTALQFVAHS
jgi:hypothetical protein